MASADVVPDSSSFFLDFACALAVTDRIAVETCYIARIQAATFDTWSVTFPFSFSFSSFSGDG